MTRQARPLRNKMVCFRQDRSRPTPRRHGSANNAGRRVSSPALAHTAPTGRQAADESLRAARHSAANQARLCSGAGCTSSADLRGGVGGFRKRRECLASLHDWPRSCQQRCHHLGYGDAASIASLPCLPRVGHTSLPPDSTVRRPSIWQPPRTHTTTLPTRYGVNPRHHSMQPATPATGAGLPSGRPCRIRAAHPCRAGGHWTRPLAKPAEYGPKSLHGVSTSSAVRERRCNLDTT